MKKKLFMSVVLILITVTVTAKAESIIRIIAIQNPSGKYVFETNSIQDIKNVQQIIDDNRRITPRYNPARKFAEDEIVIYATKFLGKPYVWGATGPDTFDCSGFVGYVYKHFGINIPRVSADQARTGTFVPKSELRPGDLVFFAYDHGKGTVHHVGMYIGEGMYIHAPKTGDVVKISALSGRSDYALARRYR